MPLSGRQESFDGAAGWSVKEKGGRHNADYEQDDDQQCVA